MTENWCITITPVPKSEDCIITTSCGQKFTVHGIAIFADGGEKNLFVFTWNSPLAAARGCMRALVEAMNNGNEAVHAFYKCLLRLLTSVTGSEDKKVVTAESLLARWDKEDGDNKKTFN